MTYVIAFNSGRYSPTSNTSQMNIGTTFNISISYNPGALPTGYTVTPLLRQAAAPNAPWVPTIVGSQQPWLLTWSVSED